jgi:hypothetical protein
VLAGGGLGISASPHILKIRIEEEEEIYQIMIIKIKSFLMV